MAGIAGQRAPVAARGSLRPFILFALLAVVACQPDSPTGTLPFGEVGLAKGAPGGGGSGGPRVTATEPDSAAQDTTIDVIVSGSGFTEGAKATWALAGDTTLVHVQSTTVLGPDRIRARIQVPATAPLASYDVEVTLSNGKKGVGAEMFKVVTRGPAPSFPVDFTITDAGLSLQSDGKGVYRHDLCGVMGDWGEPSTVLRPSGGRIPKSQKTACAGIAPRTSTVALGLRHISDDPHIDESPTPTSFNIVSIVFGFGNAQATTINAGNDGTPICGTLGLRFTPVTFPGTNHGARDELGGGQWHMYTRPWPDNKAYCENNGVVAYWHVSFDLHLQIN